MSDVAIIEPKSALAVLTDAEQFSAFYAKVKAETDAFVPDLTTEAGRKAIASMAFKVTKTKTAIDAARKLLTEDARKTVEAANKAGRVIWDQLEALADDVRKPLTEWENAEKDRIAGVENILAYLRASAVINPQDRADVLRTNRDAIIAMELDPAILQDHLAIAMSLRQTALAAITSGIERADKAEADARELEELREQKRVAEEKRLADETAARTKRNAEELAERVRLAEEASARRTQEAIEKAAQDAKDAADREAQKVKDAAEAAHKAELKALQDKVDAENKRREDEAAEAEKVRAADAARQADADHKIAVKKAAKEALIAVMPDDLPYAEEIARNIVIAIVAGEIPSITLNF